VVALGPRCQGRCAQLIDRRTTGASFQVNHASMSDFLAAQPARPQVVPAGVLGGAGPSRGSPIWATVLMIVLAIAAVVGWYRWFRDKRLLAGAASRGQRRDLPPETPARSPEGRRSPVQGRAARLNAEPATPQHTPVPRQLSSHEGRVRTELHPQGYVELDGCLYRATWTGSDQRRPGPGDRVQVTADRAGGLVALSLAGSTRPSFPSTTAYPDRPGRRERGDWHGAT
jgi:hypothetical protein